MNNKGNIKHLSLALLIGLLLFTSASALITWISPTADIDKSATIVNNKTTINSCKTICGYNCQDYLFTREIDKVNICSCRSLDDKPIIYTYPIEHELKRMNLLYVDKFLPIEKLEVVVQIE